MEGERAKSHLTEDTKVRINRILEANPTFAMIMDLPYELQREVAVQMRYPDTIRFCGTSKSAKIICDDDYFWKLKIMHDFPENPAEGHEGKWRELYKKYWKKAQAKLLSCTKAGHVKCVQSLLQIGVDPDFQYFRLARGGTYYIDEPSKTALMLASKNGNVDIVRLLLDNGADPNVSDADLNDPALLEASRNGHINVVEMLLDHGANIKYALNEAISGKHIHVARMLLNRGANPNGSEDYYTLLRAINYEDVEMVQLLLEHGADPNVSRAGRTALYMAYDNEKIIRLLIKHNVVIRKDLEENYREYL
uniref:F-box domain and ankyrin repeat protein n=1 Tax=Pithovirus LCPAC304 TaxID=2506594 RepID=A0A481ZC44_9VIRU|nr:MAG: F-box domain and ankyrin repeat protein [Pithovirus LCPAC304]